MMLVLDADDDQCRHARSHVNQVRHELAIRTPDFSLGGKARFWWKVPLDPNGLKHHVYGLEQEQEPPRLKTQTPGLA